MSDESDLRINTLHRFEKHSPRLTLQEYSHCEVPAGCGGVVLRWIDPRLGPSARVRVVAIGAVDTWLDGVLLGGDRAPLGPGRHVVALRLRSLGRMPWRGRDLDLAPPVPVAIGVYPDRGPGDRADNMLPIASGVVQRWHPGPLASPPIAPDFDDRSWRAVAHADDAALASLPADVRRPFERLAADGLTMLALGDAGAPLDEAWVRISFAAREER
ncbi:MAG: hypothetical protein KIT84_19875 [Labilithrix sp.]|nr:hypothetical protein [Labilithrix sp.]MCW5813297.1 hypothetical protein [Labilithrix sp.]